MTDNQPAGAGVEQQPIAEPASAATEAPETQSPETQETKPDVDYASEYKKLQNALSRRERNIGKMTAQKHQLLSENDQLKQKLSQYETKSQPANDKPSASEVGPGKRFATAEDYVEALTEWKASQVLNKGRQEDEKRQSEVSKKQWKEERETELSDSAAKAREAFPDFDNALKENADFFQSLPAHVEKAILESSDIAPFAFYQMVKDGSLDALLTAPNETRAARLLESAAAKAQSKPKPATKAPAPLAASKGSGSSQKSLAEKSGDELMEWLKSK